MINLTNALNNVQTSDVQSVVYTPDIIRETVLSEEASWELFEANGNLKIETANNLTVLLKSDNTVWTIGQDSFGQLGIGESSSNSTVPNHVASLSDVIDISVWLNHIKN